MNAEDKLVENGYEGVRYLTNPSYDTALIGVSESGRAVYDFNKMVEWLIQNSSLTREDAVEFIEYNTIRALPYAGEDAPVVMYALESEE